MPVLKLSSWSVSRDRQAERRHRLRLSATHVLTLRNATRRSRTKLTAPKPSKPPGCRSRRCRRRMSIGFGRASRPTTGVISSAGWRTFTRDAIVEPQIAALEGDYSGLDDLRRLFADIADSWEVFEFHFPDVRDLGDRVLALGTLRTIGKRERDRAGDFRGVPGDLPGRAVHPCQGLRRVGSSPRSRRAGSSENQVSLNLFSVTLPPRARSRFFLLCFFFAAGSGVKTRGRTPKGGEGRPLGGCRGERVGSPAPCSPGPARLSLARALYEKLSRPAVFL